MSSSAPRNNIEKMSLVFHLLIVICSTIFYLLNLILNHNYSRQHFEFFLFIFFFSFFFFFSEKIRLDISCESEDSHEMPSLTFSEK